MKIVLSGKHIYLGENLSTKLEFSSDSVAEAYFHRLVLDLIQKGLY